MGVFEILFLAVFILLPLLEKVMKRGQTGPEAPGPEGRSRPVPGEDVPGREVPGPAPVESRPGEGRPRSSEREPVKAADMVPDDLWAVLTGEERPGPGGRPGVDEESAAPAETPSPAPERWEEAWRPRPAPRSRMDDVEDAPAHASVEEYGPEAYSLETFEREPVSLEKPLESPETRHRRFHENVDRPPPRRRTRRSPIGRALQSPESVRQAFVLSEVLGTPKGLE